MARQSKQGGWRRIAIYVVIFFVGYWLIDSVVFGDANNMSSENFSFERSMVASRVERIYVLVAPILLYIWHRLSTANRGQIMVDTRLMSVYLEKLDAFLKSCFNEKTCEFDWGLFFSGRDEFLYCGIPEIVRQMEMDMRYFGHLQAQYILNTVVAPYRRRGVDHPDYERLIADLYDVEENIIRNLEDIYGQWNDSVPPNANEVKQFRDTLYDLMYRRRPCTPSVLDELNDLAVRI